MDNTLFAPPQPLDDHLAIQRRAFLGRSAAGLAAVSTLLAEDGLAEDGNTVPGLGTLPHFAATNRSGCGPRWLALLLPRPA